MKNSLLIGLLLLSILLISGCDSCKKFEGRECNSIPECIYGVAGCVFDTCTEKVDETSCKDYTGCIWINKRNLYGCYSPRKLEFARGFTCDEAEHLEDDPDKAEYAQRLKDRGNDWKTEACNEDETLSFVYALENNIIKCDARCPKL